MADDQKLLIRCFPVNFDELESATADVVDLAKIQRCNAFTTLYYPGLDEAHKQWLVEAMIAATEDPNKSSAQLPPGAEHPAKFPFDQVKIQRGPYRSHLANLARARRYCRETISPTVDHVVRSFQLHVDSWNESESCRRLRSAFRSMAAPERINKMVCFGLGYVDNVSWDDNPVVRRLRSQHAAMLTIRDTLQEMIVAAGHAERQNSIFAQDPNYDGWNRIVLENHGMTVVDARYGHHQGFLKVDRNTMVVDTTCGTIEVMQACLEFTEPVVVFTKIRQSPEIPSPNRACWTAFDQDTNTPICVPGNPFMRDSEKVIKKVGDGYTVVDVGEIDELDTSDPKQHHPGLSSFLMHVRKD